MTPLWFFLGFFDGAGLVPPVCDGPRRRVVEADALQTRTGDVCAEIAGFPHTGILDTFNRADVGPPPSSSWNTDPAYSGLKVVSNQLAPNGDSSAAIWNATQFAADQECYVTIKTRSADPGNEVYVAARLQSPLNTNDGYAVTFRAFPAGNDDAQILLFQNPNTIALGAAINLGRKLAAGDQLGIRIQGSTITAYLNGRVIGFRTNTVFPGAGYLGILMLDFSRTTRLDDFGGGAVPTACTVPRTRVPEADSQRTRAPQCHNEVAGAN